MSAKKKQTPSSEAVGSEVPEDEKHVPFMEHLQELANRVKWSIVAIVVGFLIAYFLSEPIFNALTKPLVTAFQGDKSLHFSSPTEPFFTYLTIALIGGIALAAPVIFFQLWSFIAPGLYRNEKKMVLPFLGTSVIFFFGGIAFGYLVVLPLGFEFLLNYAYDQPANFSLFQSIADWLGAKADPSKLDLPVAALEPTIMMQDYITLVMKLLLAFGIIFEMPLFIYFLARIGLVTHRHLLKFFRYFAVLAFLVGALLTPPDVITQALMAGPMLFMYSCSILVAYLVSRGRERRAAKEAPLAPDPGDDDDDPNGDPADGSPQSSDDRDEAGVDEADTETWSETYDPRPHPHVESDVDPLDELEAQLPDEGWDDGKHS